MDPLGNTTTFNYDAIGNLVSVVDPLQNTTTRQYDAASRLIRQLDPRSKPSAFAYDPLNRLTSFTDSLGGTTRFSYDGNGNMVTVTDARGGVTQHTYDAMDRLETRTDPVNATEFFVYDPAGNLIRHTDRKGQPALFTYDPLNRRTGASYVDGSTTSFAYDAGGRLVQASDSVGGTILNQYDVVDRLLAQATGLGTISYQYDPLGRRTTMMAPGQAPVSYGYDAASRLTAITQGPQVVGLTYDAAGRRTSLTLPNGVSTEYQYDIASRLTALIYRNALGPLGELTYQYDSAGNRTGVGDSFARTLMPDPVPTATYSAANRQLTFGNLTLTYDTNGNLSSDGTTTYTWDPRNRLTALAGPSATAAFLYDPLGRRHGKTVDGATTHYLYDGLDVATELTDTLAVPYLRTLSIDEALGRGPDEFYLTDALGSTMALTSQDGVAITAYSYAPFGATVVDNPTAQNPFQFTGRENDGTGLYYYRARYYHPGLQRFIAEDPLSLASGETNYYLYVGDAPLSFVDPLGLDKQIRTQTSPGRAPRAIPRLPDYYSLNLNVAVPNPLTLTLVGVSGQVVVDRNGRFYWGLGPTVGKSATVVSGSLTGGWLLQQETPNTEQLTSFLTAHSFNVGGGFVGGSQVTITPGVGTAIEFGLFSPQFGASYHYSIQKGEL